MAEQRVSISTGNLPENPPRPSRAGERPLLPHSHDRKPGSWVPTTERGDAKDACEGCGVDKLPDEYSLFFERDLDLDADTAGPMLCNYCIRYGPPMADPLGDLKVHERQAMLILASGGTVAEAARRMNVSKEKLTAILSGRERSVFRQAFQRTLQSEGLGPGAIIEAIGRGIAGKKHQWNPKEECFEEFDDLAAQGRAYTTLVKLFDLNPPQELARNVGTDGGNRSTWNITTNIGDGKVEQEVAYEVEAKVVDE